MKLIQLIHTTLLILALTLVPVQAEERKKNQVNLISVDQAKILHDNGAVFIDTRSFIERKFGLIKGTIVISKNEVSKKQNLLPSDKSKDLVVYCAKGVRAAVAADKLVQLGYQRVYVIHDAGFRDWKKKGFPIE